MNAGGLFEPDILLAEQLSAPRRRRVALSSEKRLMLAVLKNALDYYQKYIGARDAVGRQLFEEAAGWIECTGSDDVFSFENITEALDISPTYLRRGVAAWHQRLLKMHQHPVGTSAAESPPLAAAAS